MYDILKCSDFLLRTNVVWSRFAFESYLNISWASVVAQMVKNLPAMWEMRVRSLGQKDPLEKEMAPHSYSCLENSIDRGSWRATVLGFARVGHDRVTNSLPLILPLLGVRLRNRVGKEAKVKG